MSKQGAPHRSVPVVTDEQSGWTNVHDLVLLCDIVFEGQVTRYGEASRILREKLMSALYDLNVRNKFNQTVLHLAVLAGSLDFVEILLEFGADRQMRDVDGFTPLELAIARGRVDIARALLKKTTPEAGVFNLELLQDKWVFNLVNTPHPITGQTPLHQAAHKRNANMIRLLVDKGGAILLAQEKESKDTPLHIAAANGDRDSVLALLFRHGRRQQSNCMPLNNDGNNPAYLAMEEEGDEALQIFIEWFSVKGQNLVLKNEQVLRDIFIQHWREFALKSTPEPIRFTSPAPPQSLQLTALEGADASLERQRKRVIPV